MIKTNQASKMPR